jgi:hypothetical protein
MLDEIFELFERDKKKRRHAPTGKRSLLDRVSSMVGGDERSRYENDRYDRSRHDDDRRRFDDDRAGYQRDRDDDRDDRYRPGYDDDHRPRYVDDRYESRRNNDDHRDRDEDDRRRYDHDDQRRPDDWKASKKRRFAEILDFDLQTSRIGDGTNCNPGHSVASSGTCSASSRARIRRM